MVYVNRLTTLRGCKLEYVLKVCVKCMWLSSEYTNCPANNPSVQVTKHKLRLSHIAAQNWWAWSSWRISFITFGRSKLTALLVVNRSSSDISLLFITQKSPKNGVITCRLIRRLLLLKNWARSQDSIITCTGSETRLNDNSIKISTTFV